MSNLLKGVSPNEFDIPVGNKRNGAVNNCFDFDNQSCLLAKLFFQSRDCTSYFFSRQTKKTFEKGAKLNYEAK